MSARDFVREMVNMPKSGEEALVEISIRAMHHYRLICRERKFDKSQLHGPVGKKINMTFSTATTWNGILHGFELFDFDGFAMDDDLDGFDELLEFYEKVIFEAMEKTGGWKDGVKEVAKDLPTKQNEPVKEVAKDLPTKQNEPGVSKQIILAARIVELYKTIKGENRASDEEYKSIKEQMEKLKGGNNNN